LLEFIAKLHGSPDASHRDVAAYLLNAVVSAAAVALTSGFRELFGLFSSGLDDPMLSVVRTPVRFHICNPQQRVLPTSRKHHLHFRLCHSLLQG
jgi:hypothetical protein